MESKIEPEAQSLIQSLQCKNEMTLKGKGREGKRKEEKRKKERKVSEGREEKREESEGKI